MVNACIEGNMFRKTYADVFKGDQRWQGLNVPTGETFAWEEASTYVKNPPYFESMTITPKAVEEIKGARVLAVLGHSITTDHISPAGSIKKDSPAGKYLIEHGVKVGDFNSYGSRRGNHEVMMRGTFANTRLRNKMVPGKEGGFTRHYPSKEDMTIFDASERYRAEGVPTGDSGGQRVRLGFVARLGGEGSATARRARGDCRELRTHSSFEPGGHGDPAAAVLSTAKTSDKLRLDRRGDLRDPRAERRRSTTLRPARRSR